jgi:hypothetical protein
MEAKLNGAESKEVHVHIISNFSLIHMFQITFFNNTEIKDYTVASA